jgi:peptide/nickel transport system permease protein
MAIARRVAWSLVVAWVVISATFVVNELLPGDPARVVAGIQARPADVARIRAQLGLDRPPAVRYVRFWKRLIHVGPREARIDPEHATCAVILPVGGRAVHVDFGRSFQMSRPVIDVIAERLPRTFVLAIAGVAMQLVFGAVLGVASALWRGTWIDRLLVGASVFGISVPTFLTALVLQTVFARELRWLPLDGFGATLPEHALSLVLPALTLGIYGGAFYTRLVRDEMVVLMRRDWIRTARAKGLGPAAVAVRHGLRNAMLPVFTALALDLGALMGGAIVTETIFRWPGLGQISVQATADRDGPVVCACVIVTSVAVIAANLAVDLTYGWLDPRVTALRARDSR